MLRTAGEGPTNMRYRTTTRTRTAIRISLRICPKKNIEGSQAASIG